MKWRLLSQHYVSSGYLNYDDMVLEEAVSSELQLVQVLVSGRMSLTSMKLLGHGQEWFSHSGLEDREFLT